ncbi:phage head morphogenesis protein [Lactobacillus sp. S2-2]|uniref:minor capsid protein n=1 Tax=Lactobacillus sp. S2-2 TaxID=2692917 RepID=UPI001F017127|nr:minor capsid protein [Lactobacillus sp. S2-2]MCF6515564.1 phage head morphogenesis protein [Lactobacillus sp. S2-2]
MARIPYNEQENRSYWRKRHLKLKAKQIESTEEYQRQLYKRLGYVERAFENELKSWYKKYASNNNIDFEQASNLLKDIDTQYFDLTLDEFKSKALEGGYDRLLNNQYFKERVTRLKALQKDFESKLSDEAVDEAKKMKDVLANQYQDRYYQTAYTIDMERKVINHNLAKINDEAAKVIVSKSWQGSDFSERIWHNYRNELPSQLTDSLLKSSLRGDSYTRLMKDFKQRFTDVKRKHIKRLVVTEMGHVDETATIHAYESEGLQKYEYVATLERRTCDQCAGLDGKVFNLKDKVVALNYPLMHPYCRCTTIPYVESNPTIDSRYDQENHKIIKNISYEKWKEPI